MRNRGVVSSSKNKELLKWSLFFFVFLVLYSFFITNKLHLWQFDEYTYTLYLVDYSFGFCSKFLPGAFYHLFFKDVLAWKLNLFVISVMGLFLLFVALTLGKLIVSESERSSRTSLAILFYFFLSGPGTFAIVTHHPGIYENYWLILCLAFVWLISNRYLRWLTPFLFALSVLIHYSSLLSFVLFFALILLFEANRSDIKEKRVFTFLLVVGSLSALALSIYLILFEKSNLRYSLDEFNRVLQQRNIIGYKINTNYFQSAFYDSSPLPELSGVFEEYFQHPWIDVSVSRLPNGIIDIINKIGYYFTANVSVLKQSNFALLAELVLLNITLLPLLSVFYGYWKRKLKMQTTFFGKSLFCLIMLQYPLTLSACLVSTDYIRMTMHAFIIQFILAIYIAFKDKEWKCLTVNYFLNADVRYVLFYTIVYSVIFIDPV